MKRFALFLLLAALSAFTPAAIFADEVEADLDFAATNTTCPTCGPVVEPFVYFDNGGDGKYDADEDETRDRWRVFLYAIDPEGDWELIDFALTGGSDGVYDSGSDSGKAYFRPLKTNALYAVCAEFPRDWLFLTEPTEENLSPDGPLRDNLTGGWNTGPLVSVVENPQPLADDNPQPGERNWDESALCYKVKLRSLCNNVKLRFGVLTYDTLADKH